MKLTVCTKFKHLLRKGFQASLTVEANIGEAFINLKVGVGGVTQFPKMDSCVPKSDVSFPKKSCRENEIQSSRGYS